ncbi:MAG: hypothetical protein IKQ01_06535 [Bacteroidales bacterium]|nr:hypothetical protein [Bacteroidales bacterium]
MNNEQAADALIRLSVPFGNLCEDEKVVEIIKKFQGISDQPMIQTMGRIIPELVTFAFKTHKDDLYEIVGALTNQTTDKVAKMNFVTTVNILKESYDDTLRDFFTSYKQRIKENADQSSQD